MWGGGGALASYPPGSAAYVTDGLARVAAPLPGTDTVCSATIEGESAEVSHWSLSAVWFDQKLKIAVRAGRKVAI